MIKDRMLSVMMVNYVIIGLSVSLISIIGTALLLRSRFQKKYKKKVIIAIEETVAAERLRIGTELHDSTVQRLQAIRMRLERSMLFPLRPEVAEELETCTREITNEIRGIRLMIDNDLAGQVIKGKFSEAIANFCKSVDGLMNRKVSFKNVHAEQEFMIDELIQLELFRICQQLIQNAFSHGFGNTIFVTLEWGHQLQVTTRDDGKGLMGNRKGLGTYSIQERAKKIGASLTVGSGFGGVKTKLVYQNQKETMRKSNLQLAQ